jgi:hypothetical protein
MCYRVTAGTDYMLRAGRILRGHSQDAELCVLGVGVDEGLAVMWRVRVRTALVRRVHGMKSGSQISSQ